MKKKIFTLLSCVQLLFMTAYVSHAQPWLGDPVKSLLGEDVKNAFHLRVVALGDEELTVDEQLASEKYNPSKGLFLAMDNLGRLTLRDGTHFTIAKPGDTDATPLERLHETLWCLDTRNFTPGHQAYFTFLNKHYGTELSVSSSTPSLKAWESGAPKLGDNKDVLDSVRVYQFGADSTVLLGGNVYQWLAGATYLEAVADEFALRAPLTGSWQGWYVTFAVGSKNKAGVSNGGLANRGLVLALAHENDFKPDAKFYKEHLIRFALRKTAPRLLTAGGIKTLLGTEGITINPTFTLADGESNPFAGITNVTPVESYNIRQATGNGTETDGKTGSDPYHVRLKIGNETGTSARYLIVNDGPELKNFYSGNGWKYPKISTTNRTDTAKGRADFRFVYYPSAGSVVVTVRQLRIPTFDNNGNVTASGTFYTDTVTQHMETYTDSNGRPVNHWIEANDASNPLSLSGKTWGDFYSYQHSNLFVLPQNIATDRYVVTAGASATSVGSLSDRFYIGAGSAGCTVADGRASVPRNDLYLVKAEKVRTTDPDRYLTVPLYTGTYSPQWVEISQAEALKSPAFHWFARKYDGSDISKVELTNREFEGIKFDYVQLTTTASKFNGTWSKSGVPVDQNYFGTNVGDALVSASSFRAITEPEYRKNPYLGYRNTDTDGGSLTAGNYTFEYYHAASSSPYYIGLKPIPTTDTFFYAVPAATRTLFKVEAPDNKVHGYGIQASFYKDHGFNVASTPSADSISLLQRRPYRFAVADYSSSERNQNYVTLSKTTNYVHRPALDASASKSQAAIFYLRYQFSQRSTADNTVKDYYTLLQRVEPSNFSNTLSKELELELAQNLWTEHGGSDTVFGVLQVAVDPYYLTIKAVSRFGTSEAPSAFALQALDDPLYRRLNDAGLGDPTGTDGDKPRVLRFFRSNAGMTGQKDYLYEDLHSASSINDLGIKFLGLINEKDAALSPYAPFNFDFYVDTAFVNREGYTLKPQYLLAVDTETGFGFPNACPTCATDTVDKVDYVLGRYLKNAYDSAWKYTFDINKADASHTTAYAYGLYNRLIFVDAVHAGDSLYVLKTPTIDGVNASFNACIDTLKANYTTSSGELIPINTPYLNFAKLRSTSNSQIVPLNRKGAHHDHAFSFRYAQPTGSLARPFHIESEAPSRDNGIESNKFGQNTGGWIKYINNLLVISRRGTSDSESIDAAEWFDVELSDGSTANKPIESVSSDLQVVSGSVGSVTILNASGKRVVLSNVLGQTISTSVLTSDRAVLSAPRGVVVVSVEGAGTTKAIVK